jgi:4-amino-4-deoxy-L-arabinose transferase
MLSLTPKVTPANIYLCILLLFALALRLYAIQADPFLHDWDERFHALVARNMMETPFAPTLQREIVGEYDPFSWCCNTIWLHKQPLFMWQMALSMKIFGANEWALRLPSAIMATIMVFFLYRCTFLLSKRTDIAFLAAALLTCSGFQLQLISGIRGMDHNDIALQFYVLASFWAWAERSQKAQPHWIWMIFIGLFAGAAVLNKWLIGLAVFLPWGLLTLRQMSQKRSIWPAAPFLLALATCVAVFLPWQIYILQQWPTLAAHEFEFNRRHLSEALEGHSGTIFYYLEHMAEMVGSYIYYLFPLGAFAFYRHSHQLDKNLLFAFSLILGFVFCFFSFFVATKVMAHFFFVAPFLYIFVAAAISFFSQLWRPILPVLGLTAMAFALQPLFFIDYFSPDNTARNHKIANAEVYRNLQSQLPEGCRTVANLPDFGQIELQFYAPQLRATAWSPQPHILDSLAQKGEKIAAFRSHGHYHLSAEILNYPYITILNQKIY